MKSLPLRQVRLYQNPCIVVEIKKCGQAIAPLAPLWISGMDHVCAKRDLWRSGRIAGFCAFCKQNLRFLEEETEHRAQDHQNDQNNQGECH
jgi:hypothetical protein